MAADRTRELRVSASETRAGRGPIAVSAFPHARD